MGEKVPCGFRQRKRQQELELQRNATAGSATARVGESGANVVLRHSKKDRRVPVFFSITMEWDENPRSGRERNYLFTNNSANKIYIYYSENLTYNEPKNEVSDLYNEEKDVNMK